MSLGAARSHDILSAIIRAKKIGLEEVLVLRRQVWPDGAVSRGEAEMLFRIDEALEESCGEWTDFFTETITAHLVEQAHPRGYVTDEDAAWLEQRVLKDGRIRGATELETLIRLLERASHVPHRLEILALETVRDAVLEGDGEIVADGRLEKGVLGDPEVALLRRILYAQAGARSEAISRDEAELLFELEDATDSAANCSAWTTLFVNGIANFLLVQSGYEPPSRDRMKEIDTWLNRPTSGVAGFAKAMVTSKPAGGFFADIKAAFTGESPMEAYYRERVAADTAAQHAAERVEAEEAAWLIERLKRDGTLSPNEAALLAFLKTGGYAVDPSLEPLLKSA